jgi:hypothetical protein
MTLPHRVITQVSQSPIQRPVMTCLGRGESKHHSHSDSCGILHSNNCIQENKGTPLFHSVSFWHESFHSLSIFTCPWPESFHSLSIFTCNPFIHSHFFTCIYHLNGTVGINTPAFLVFSVVDPLWQYLVIPVRSLSPLVVYCLHPWVAYRIDLVTLLWLDTVHTEECVRYFHLTKQDLFETLAKHRQRLLVAAVWPVGLGIFHFTWWQQLTTNLFEKSSNPALTGTEEYLWLVDKFIHLFSDITSLCSGKDPASSDQRIPPFPLHSVGSTGSRRTSRRTRTVCTRGYDY